MAGALERAAELMKFVQLWLEEHPFLKSRYEEIYPIIEAGVAPEILEKAYNRVHHFDMDEIVQELLAEYLKDDK